MATSFIQDCVESASRIRAHFPAGTHAHERQTLCHLLDILLKRMIEIDEPSEKMSLHTYETILRGKDTFESFETYLNSHDKGIHALATSKTYKRFLEDLSDIHENLDPKSDSEGAGWMRVFDAETSIRCVLSYASLLFCGTSRGTIQVWNPSTGKKIRTLPAHVGEVKSLGAKEDYLFSGGGRDGLIHIWDINTFKSLKTLTRPPNLDINKQTGMKVVRSINALAVHGERLFAGTVIRHPEDHVVEETTSRPLGMTHHPPIPNQVPTDIQSSQLRHSVPSKLPNSEEKDKKKSAWDFTPAKKPPMPLQSQHVTLADHGPIHPHALPKISKEASWSRSKSFLQLVHLPSRFSPQRTRRNSNLSSNESSGDMSPPPRRSHAPTTIGTTTGWRSKSVLDLVHLGSRSHSQDESAKQFTDTVDEWDINTGRWLDSFEWSFPEKLHNVNVHGDHTVSVDSVRKIVHYWDLEISKGGTIPEEIDDFPSEDSYSMSVGHGFMFSGLQSCRKFELIDLDHLKEHTKLPHHSHAKATAMAIEGCHLYIATTDGNIRVWDLSREDPHSSYKFLYDITTPHSTINYLAVENGLLFSSGPVLGTHMTSRKSCSVVVWNLKAKS